jgi:putative NADPH-quinone reductase
MILIIADNKEENFGSKLYRYYKDNNEDVEFMGVSDLDIKPCYACGGCTQKTFGKCLVRDDMDKIIPLLMKCETVIYTSPLLWGGFSYIVKKVVDKMALTGSVFYKEKNKELVKGTISNMKKLIGIGVGDNVSDKERVSFENHIREIAIIIDIKYLGKVFRSRFTEPDIEKLAMEVNGL